MIVVVGRTVTTRRKICIAVTPHKWANDFPCEGVCFTKSQTWTALGGRSGRGRGTRCIPSVASDTETAASRDVEGGTRTRQ